MKSRFQIIAVVAFTAVLSLLLPLAAQAASFPCGTVAGNLVANCGFETGTFSSWTVGGNTGFTSVSSAYAHSGTYGARLGAVSNTSFANANLLSQNLTTVAGDTYTLTYWLFSPGGSPNGFEVSWNGTVVAGSVLVNAGPFPYTEFMFSGLAATGGSTQLLFRQYQNPSYWGLDDISVVQTGVGAPEPGVLVLLPMSLIGLGLLRRKLNSYGASSSQAAIP